MGQGDRIRPARVAAGLAWALLGALALAGCNSLPQEKPATEVALPPAAPRTTGAETEAQREHKRLVAVFGGEYRSPATERYLNDVLARLAAASETPSVTYRVTILNSPAINAFALPSGNLYVTRGLLALANDGAEAAAVMAHEMGHVTAGHAAARAEMEKRSAVVSQAANVIQSRERGEAVEANAKLTLASFSRQQELEADAIGVRTMAKAGFDPYGASRFLASLGRSAAQRAGAAKGAPDIMATHPSTPERIAAALNAARQLGAPGIGDAQADAYLSAIDGLAFGDDPSDGVIRGRRFLHPRLGFAFLAPEGFQLENTARAVLGAANGGAQALRLDSVRVPATTTLESYLASGWIEGLQTASVESVTINGFPAAIGIAKGGEWMFRVAAIRVGSDVYRMIFATRGALGERDRLFLDAINSFHRVSGEEAADARPLRVAIVTAGEGDTAETLSRRMAATDRPLESFLVLNGLDRAGPLKAGQRYKIVSE